MENKIKHPEMRESNIERMGSNSFQLKGWAVTLVPTETMSDIIKIIIKYSTKYLTKFMLYVTVRELGVGKPDGICFDTQRYG